MAHIHEKIDFVVEAFIVHDNTVLLVDHKKLGKILPVGGHIELDEDPDEAIFREIQEESGLNRSDLIVLSEKIETKEEGIKFLFTPNFMNIHDISDTHKHVCLVYFMKSNTNNVVLAEKEHNFIKWFTKDELTNGFLNLLPNIRFYALEALKKAHF